MRYDTMQEPTPRYTARLEKSVMIPMRDGVRLSTDLYVPNDAPGPRPVILMRTPYNKLNARQPESSAWLFAGQGYIVAVQDLRGSCESEGQYRISANDRADGSDSVSWLARQSWSNGRVGTYGCSHLGEVQYQLATQRNPHHACAVPQAGGSAFGYHGPSAAYHTNGAFPLLFADWFRTTQHSVHPQFPPGLDRELLLQAAPYFALQPQFPDVDWHKLWRTLPIIDTLRAAGSPPTDFENFVGHPPEDPWWESRGFVTWEDRFDVPALHVNSWYDFGVAETLVLFNLFQTNAETERARDNQFVIISPTLHCRSEVATQCTVVGELDLGDARFPCWETYLRWFDYWLNGDERARFEMPKVQYYVMGRGQWRAADAWPLPETRFTNFYLHSQGRANSRFGDGLLSQEPPADERADRFVYDPVTPVPTVGGTHFPMGDPPLIAAGAFDRSEVEARHDVLVYTTAPLERGIEVTGPIELFLHVSSSARDTDFTAALVDVHPDGRAYIIQEGIQRARYREGYTRQVQMLPDEVYEVRVDLRATSNFFQPGHRIRLEISSSNFPRWDRNLNTGGNNFDESTWVVAENTIHHNAARPSRLVLPIIP
jgi:putative CocE/NonD family hydrolase